MKINNLSSWLQLEINKFKFKKLTEIQEKTIPLLMKNKNVIGVSSTGSGKTLAFLVPALNKLNHDNKNIQLVIISPTRELATQIYKITSSIIKYQKGLSIQFISGGEKTETIRNKINNKKPQIIIATPTKLIDVVSSNEINLSYVNNLIIDEADMLMDLDFWKYIDAFFELLENKEIQKSAWSATLHEQLSLKLKKIFKDTKIIQIGESIYKNKKINHYVIQTNDNFRTLDTLINLNNFYLCIIFANTKKEVDEIYDYLKNKKINVIKLHGDLSKRERSKNFNDIKKLKYQFIVASDLASRGMDIDGVSHVISWNLPSTLDWYIHRSGRCGRGKYTGDSYILHNGTNFKEIDKLKEKKIEFDFYVEKNNSLKKININQLEMNNKKNVKENKIITNKQKRVKPNYKKKIRK